MLGLRWWAPLLLLLLLLVVATALALALLARKRKREQAWAKDIPCPPGGNFILGHLSNLALLGEGPESLMRWTKGLAPVGRIDMGLFLPGPFIIALDPVAAKIALRSEWKGSFYDGLRINGEDNLLVGEGGFWRKQRRTVNPAFSYSSIRKLHPIMIEEVENLFVHVDARKKQYIDLDDLFGRFTLDVIGRTIYGQSFKALQEPNPPVLEAIKGTLHEVQLRERSILRKYLNFPAYRRLRRYQQVVRQIGLDAMKERRKQADWEQINDLLSVLMRAEDPETGERMSDYQISLELEVFTGAGHETTAHTMAWTVYHLLKNPDAMKKVRQEVDQILGDRPYPSEDEIKEFKYLTAAIHESMRIAPVAPLGSVRTMSEDVDLCGHFVPRGTSVWVPFYPLFRNAQTWPEPEKFDIERFLNDDQHKKFFPFSGGPRNCIGQTLARREMVIGLASLLRNYDIQLKDDAQVVAVHEITLKPEGLIVRMENREL